MSRIQLAGCIALALVAVACGPRTEPGSADADVTKTTTRPVPQSPVEVVAEPAVPAESVPTDEGAGDSLIEAPAPVVDLEPTLDQLDSLLDDLEQMLSEAAANEGEM